MCLQLFIFYVSFIASFYRNGDDILSVLLNLTRVKRFAMTTMFMSSSDKKSECILFDFQLLILFNLLQTHQCIINFYFGFVPEELTCIGVDSGLLSQI
jgi:hypothetical protein